MRVQETVHVPAKLNLFLGVQPRIIDGKHPLTSVFTTISLCDTLTFNFDTDAAASLSSETVTLDMIAESEVLSSGFDADKNIVLSAVRMFEDVFGLSQIAARSLHITLEKRIPMQAGLGGGSSDAASTLEVLARHANIDKTSPKLIELARELGADVPFFLYGGCALMGGFGDELLEELPQPCLHVVLVKPVEGVSTGAVYQAFDELFMSSAKGEGLEKAGDLERMENPESVEDPEKLEDLERAEDPEKSEGQLTELLDHTPLVKALKSGCDVYAICNAMDNNLEPASHKVLNKIAIIQGLLNESPEVIKTMLAGSGSVIFGVCADAVSTNRVAERFTTQGYWAHTAVTQLDFMLPC